MQRPVGLAATPGNSSKQTFTIMKISELIEQLEAAKKEHGDIEVTCTGTYLRDGYSEGGTLKDVFETTVETLVYKNDGELGSRVRLYL